jgi:hypothetical protein
MRRSVVAALLVLLACGSSGHAAATSTTAPPADTDADGVVDADDAYPNDPAYSVPLTVTVRCVDLDTFNQSDATYGWETTLVIDRVTVDFSEAWATPFPPETRISCNTVGEDGFQIDIEEPVTDIERADWEGTDPQYRDYTIGINYANCVEHGTAWMAGQFPVSINQAVDVPEMFTYCPDHPDRAAIEGRMAALGVEQGERDEGVRFGSGLYRVGEDIQPGTYFTESEEGFEACYWERQDSSGEIIDNFQGQVFRAEVTIAPSDYAFLTEGCGEWRPLE